MVPQQLPDVALKEDWPEGLDGASKHISEQEERRKQSPGDGQGAGPAGLSPTLLSSWSKSEMLRLRALNIKEVLGS